VAWATSGNSHGHGHGRGRSSILGRDCNLGGKATTAVATTATATNCFDLVVVNDGGGSLQRRGKDVLPPPSSSSCWHWPSSMPNRSEGALWIIKMSVASCHIFGGGGIAGGGLGWGGMEANDNNATIAMAIAAMMEGGGIAPTM
jgi:hypothetical protein